MADSDRVIDKSTLHRYRIELPIMLDDMDLSVYAFRLYIHMKRRAGDDGSCWEGSRALAKACHMSLGQVAKAKKELKDKGLITIEKYKTKTGDGDNISVVDLWPKNFETYAKAEESVHTVNATPDGAFTTRTDSVHTVNAKRSYSEQERSRGGSEEDPMKKIHEKRERNDSPARSPAISAYFEILPGHSLTGTQVQKINETVTDLKRWRKTLEEWALNGWDARRIGKILDRYQSGRTMQDERPAGANGTHHDPHERPPLPVIPPAHDLPNSQEAARKLAAMLKEQRHD